MAKKPLSRAETRRNLEKVIPPSRRNWLIAFIAVYAAFIFLDLFVPAHAGLAGVIKYSSIALVVAYTLVYHHKDFWLSAAMIATLLADSVLMIMSDRLLGVLVFIVVQLLHTWRLDQKQTKLTALFGLAAAVIGLAAGWNLLYVAAAVYAVAILKNWWAALEWRRVARRSQQALNALLAFTLFIICDIFVALSYAQANEPFPRGFGTWFGFFIFVFYFPSQVLMAESSRKSTHS